MGLKNKNSLIVFQYETISLLPLCQISGGKIINFHQKNRMIRDHYENRR